MTFLQLVVIISSIVFSVQSFAEKPKLRVLNWSEYMDPAPGRDRTLLKLLIQPVR